MPPNGKTLTFQPKLLSIIIKTVALGLTVPSICMKLLSYTWIIRIKYCRNHFKHVVIIQFAFEISPVA